MMLKKIFFIIGGVAGIFLGNSFIAKQFNDTLTLSAMFCLMIGAGALITFGGFCLLMATKK